MGYDATNYLPATTSKKKLAEFLKMLGYIGYGDSFYFYEDADYKYLYGVFASIIQNEDGISVSTRTSYFCSNYDLKYQNYTIKQIKSYFGGYFISDEGKNRYFVERKVQTNPAERGCYTAYFNLHNEFCDLMCLLLNYKPDEQTDSIIETYGTSPSSLLSNISTTYISSIIENYFRQLYVALLKYSSKKEKIIANAKMNGYDLYNVAKGNLCIEEAVALSKSFQNINKINAYFKEIDNGIDIYGELSKPYRRRKETLFQTIDRVLEQRHALVHRLDVKKKYNQTELKKDIDSIKTALRKVYEHICSVHDWNIDTI